MPINALTHFAETTGGGLFDALGINLQMLIFQIIGFLVLVFVMGKYIFPVLNKSIDAREAAIRESAELAEKARKDALATEEKIQAELKQAKKVAADMIDIAHKESASLLEAAEEKAKKRADHIVDTAQARLEQDVLAARETLRRDMKNLVADATEAVIKQKMTSTTDKKLIEEVLSPKGSTK